LPGQLMMKRPLPKGGGLFLIHGKVHHNGHNEITKDTTGRWAPMMGFSCDFEMRLCRVEAETVNREVRSIPKSRCVRRASLCPL
ncbi:MAG: hypothetical protein REJ23_15800, partial [Brevundimonas sp.]|nr:hypothetical protein [Brevundimonas sp.]